VPGRRNATGGGVTGAAALAAANGGRTGPGVTGAAMPTTDLARAVVADAKYECQFYCSERTSRVGSNRVGSNKCGACY
jgi:hypothetical protein